jgi:hypothetical protein
MFHLNPEAALPDQVLVLVESRAGVCRGVDHAKSQAIRIACGEAEEPQWRGKPVTRIGSNTFWDYVVVLPRNGAAEAPGYHLASCFRMERNDGRGGLCSEVFRYRDLVVTMKVNEKDVNHLEAMRDQTIALLDRWKKGD